MEAEFYALELIPESDHIVLRVLPSVLRPGTKLRSKRYPDLDAILSALKQLRTPEIPLGDVEKCRSDLRNGKNYLLRGYLRLTPTQVQWLIGP